MSMICRCTDYLGTHFSEPGLVRIINEYAAEPPPDRDIILRLLWHADSCQSRFGFCFKYTARTSQLLFSTSIIVNPLGIVEPCEIANRLVDESTREYVRKFIGFRSMGGMIVPRCGAYLEMMSKDLHEFSTPRCRHY